MNPREFYDTVVSMRAIQQKYKETKSPSDLEECIKIEKIIDTEIKRVELILKVQNMFPSLDLKPIKCKEKHE